MKKLLLLIMVTISMTLTAHAVPADNPEDTVQQYLMPQLKENNKALMLFAAELNISNGDPAKRNFGERYMFGKLVSADTVVQAEEELQLNGVDIASEVERLLLGPWHNNGSSKLIMVNVGEGKALNLETGKWEKTSGDVAIRVEHTTEYYNKGRVAYIVQHGSYADGRPMVTLFRKDTM